MKRQIFTLMIALFLVAGTALVAQTTGNTLKPSQQVDQSGKPETGSGPDVDVDAGRNAEDGLVDVDVDANTDSDTAAQGNDPNPTAGTATGRTGVTGTGTTGTGTTGTTGTYGTTDTDNDVDADNDLNTDNNLPDTASGMPLLGLIGLLALGGAVAIKATR